MIIIQVEAALNTSITSANKCHRAFYCAGPNLQLTLLDLLIDIDTRFSAFYRLASRLNYKLKNLRLELFRTFLISSFQWRTLYWPQMSFSTSFILKKKVTLGLVVRIRNSVNFSKLYVGNSMVICV